MFESTLISTLKAVSSLTSLLTTYKSSPAIFSDYAPEEAVRPYIVCSITKNSTESLVCDSFIVNIDYWDYDKSRTNARLACEIVEKNLDTAILTNERYTTLRFYRGSSGLLEDPDPKVIHFNCQMSARGTRKKWMTT